MQDEPKKLVSREVHSGDVPELGGWEEEGGGVGDVCDDVLPLGETTLALFCVERCMCVVVVDREVY